MEIGRTRQDRIGQSYDNNFIFYHSKDYACIEYKSTVYSFMYNMF